MTTRAQRHRPPGFLVILGLLLLFAAGSINRRLIGLRDTYGLSSTVAIENAPPLLAFTTVALGGFRGLLADILWLRASHLQERGDYVEVAQLSDWIAELEPRCTEIWGFHAWNMAYNISVMLPDPQDRWRWVRNGIELLRQKGLVYNPGAPGLYRELGWLFQHKIGTNLDDTHAYYKQAWRDEMEALLGSGYPDYAALTADPDRLDTLKETYRLDPGLMQQIDARYGPLDWRDPLTHAVYWATRAKQVAPDGIYLPADRMIFQSLATAVRTGSQARTGSDGPNLAVLNGALRAYEDALGLYEEKTVKTSYMNFLGATIPQLVQQGQAARAAELRKRLRKLQAVEAQP